MTCGRKAVINCAKGKEGWGSNSSNHSPMQPITHMNSRTFQHYLSTSIYIMSSQRSYTTGLMQASQTLSSYLSSRMKFSSSDTL